MANEELAWKYASSLGSTLSFRMVDDKHVLFIGWQASLAPFFFFVPVFFCYLLCWPSVGFLLRLFLRRPREEYDRQLRMLLLLLSPKEEKEAQKKKKEPPKPGVRPAGAVPSTFIFARHLGVLWPLLRLRLCRVSSSVSVLVAVLPSSFTVGSLGGAVPPVPPVLSVSPASVRAAAAAAVRRRHGRR